MNRRLPRAPMRIAAIIGLMITLTCALEASFAKQKAATAPSSTANVLKALDSQLPPSFDFAVGDPCSGPWTMILPGTGDPLRLMVMRYKGVALVHVAGVRREDNAIWSKVGPQTIRFKAGRVVNVLTCKPDRASVVSTMVIDGKLQTFPVEVHRGNFSTP